MYSEHVLEIRDVISLLYGTYCRRAVSLLATRLINIVSSCLEGSKTYKIDLVENGIKMRINILSSPYSRIDCDIYCGEDEEEIYLYIIGKIVRGDGYRSEIVMRPTVAKEDLERDMARLLMSRLMWSMFKKLSNINQLN